MIKNDISNIVAITVKNMKVKFRNWQTYLFAFGFPLFFTFIFFPIFGLDPIPGTDYRIFDLAIAGMFVYAASFGITNASTALCGEKDKGMLVRLDTTPIGRRKIFIGTLLSELVFLTLQLLMMFIIAYAILRLYWYNYDPFLLIFGFGLMLIFGFACVGIGIVISSYAKSTDVAVGISLMIVMPMVFMSGALMPLDWPIIYFMLPFYPFQIYRQVVVLGENFWFDCFKLGGIDVFNAQPFFNIPIWGAFLFTIGYTILFILVGIYLFQKKTLS